MTIPMMTEREEALRLWRALQVAVTARIEAQQEAHKRLRAYPEVVCLMYGADGEGVPMRCAKSGVVILESDELLYDEDTDEYFLRSALGLPPRPVKVEEEIEEAA